MDYPTIVEGIAVNGNAGAFVNLTSTKIARQIVIEEDPNNGGAGQGLAYQLASEGFATTHFLESGAQLPLGNSTAQQGAGKGSILGWPAQNSGGSAIAATIYAKVRSATATATKARTTEIS